MTRESILKISECYGAKAKAAPDVEHVNILQRCIVAMAEDVASTVFLAAQTEAAKTPPEQRNEVCELLEARAALVGCDFALQVRKSVHPDLPRDGAITQVEEFAAANHWAALERLVQTVRPEGHC